MNDKVIITTRDGSSISLEQWQQLYGLPVGSTQIGKYYSYQEECFKKDIERYGQLVVNELLMRVMDRYREKKKASVNANAFNRDEQKQKELSDRGFRTAKVSPHVEKMAVDVDTPGIQELRTTPTETVFDLWRRAESMNREQVRLIRQAAEELGILVRIGNEQYLKEGSTFVHIDVCPEYYAKGKPFHKQNHPRVWESPINW